MIRSLAAAAVLLAAASAASAQPAPGQTPSPAMQAARAKMMEQCGADMKKFCDGKEGQERGMCMREHAAEMSDGCKAAMQEMMAARQAGG